MLLPDCDLDPEAFEQFLAAQPDLGPKQWPRFVRIAPTLPQTATNKVLKRELVAEGLDVTDPVWVREERGTSYSGKAPAARTVLRVNGPRRTPSVQPSRRPDLPS